MWRASLRCVIECGIDMNDKKPLERLDVPYTPSFCEENVYKLASLRQDIAQHAYVVYITNKAQKTPIWAHQKCPDNDAPVVWDYHVIYIEANESDHDKVLIYDHDSVLRFPETAVRYLLETFRPSFPLRKEYKQYVISLLPLLHSVSCDRYFRVVSAASYIEHFASDRSHMLRDGAWLSAPPSWPEIRGSCASSGNTFPHYINMDSTDKYGTPHSKYMIYVRCYGHVYSLPQFAEFIDRLIHVG